VKVRGPAVAWGQSTQRLRMSIPSGGSEKALRMDFLMALSPSTWCTTCMRDFCDRDDGERGHPSARRNDPGSVLPNTPATRHALTSAFNRRSRGRCIGGEPYRLMVGRKFGEAMLEQMGSSHRALIARKRSLGGISLRHALAERSLFLVAR